MSWCKEVIELTQGASSACDRTCIHMYIFFLERPRECGHKERAQLVRYILIWREREREREREIEKERERERC